MDYPRGALRGEIIRLLGQNPQGLSATQITSKLFTPKDSSQESSQELGLKTYLNKSFLVRYHLKRLVNEGIAQRLPEMNSELQERRIPYRLVNQSNIGESKEGGNDGQ